MRILTAIIAAFLSAAASAQQIILQPTDNILYGNTPQVVQVAVGDLFYDNGGPAGSYVANRDTQLNLVAPGGGILEVQLNYYNVEANYDFLYIYDGADKTAPQLAVLDGISNVPLTFTASTAAGLTIRLDSDFSQNRAGWEGVVTSVGPVAIPVACTGFLPPFDRTLNVTRKARAIPVKLFASIPDGAAAPVVNVLFGSEANDSIVGYDADLEPAGLASEGNVMSLNDNGEWQLNISTKPYTASGVYTVEAVAGDATYELVGCTSQQFVR